MNRDTIKRAFARRLEILHNTVSNTVRFRGADLSVILAPVDISLDLVNGGLQQGGTFNCRFRVADLTRPPVEGETVTVGESVFTINSVAEPWSSAHRGEYLTTIIPAA